MLEILKFSNKNGTLWPTLVWVSLTSATFLWKWWTFYSVRTRLVFILGDVYYIEISLIFMQNLNCSKFMFDYFIITSSHEKFKFIVCMSQCHKLIRLFKETWLDSINVFNSTNSNENQQYFRMRTPNLPFKCSWWF